MCLRSNDRIASVACSFINPLTPAPPSISRRASGQRHPAAVVLDKMTVERTRAWTPPSYAFVVISDVAALPDGLFEQSARVRSSRRQRTDRVGYGGGATA